MKQILFLLSVILPVIGYGQNESSDPVIQFPDVEAQFSLGNENLPAWIAEHIIYPQEAKDLMEQGKVYVSFIVEKTGEITNIKIERGVSPSLDQESKRVIRSMPSWTPGEKGGQKIRSKVMIPVTFIAS